MNQNIHQSNKICTMLLNCASISHKHIDFLFLSTNNYNICFHPVKHIIHVIDGQIKAQRHHISFPILHRQDEIIKG